MFQATVSSSTDVALMRELEYNYVSEFGQELNTTGKWVETKTVVPGLPNPQIQVGVVSEPQHDVTFSPSYFLTPRNREPFRQIAQRYGALQLSGQESKVVDFVRLIEPRIEYLVPIMVGEEVVMHAVLEKEKLRYSAQLLGEGTARAIEFATVMGSTAGGLVLIDELENGLHHSALIEFFSRLSDLANHFNVQVFATTHSWECVKAAHDALGPVGERFNYHRIGRRDGKARAVSYDEEMLNTAFEVGWEIR